MTVAAQVLRVTAASLEFQNPVLLAAGTAAYGRELSGVIDLESLGGIVTKAVSPEPSVRAQCHHWLDPRRATCRQIAGRERHRREQRD